MPRLDSIAIGTYVRMQMVPPVTKAEKPADRKPEPDWSNKPAYDKKKREYIIDILV